MKTNTLNLLNKTFVNLILIFISLTFLFSRSFMGLYFFGYRLGELLVGFALVFWVFCFVLVIFKKYSFMLSNTLLGAIFLLPLSFISIVLIRENNLFSTYTFKASSYIWTVSFFFIE